MVIELVEGWMENFTSQGKKKDKINEMITAINAGGGAPAIDDITDVVITSPADNEVLAFDDGSGDWINQTPAEANLPDLSSNNVFTGTQHINNITDADITDDNAALVIGTKGGTHLEIDNNEILAKTDTTTPGTLNLQVDGGTVRIGTSAELQVPKLGGSQIVETDGSKNLISASKNTAYNKIFGASAGQVSEGNHSHTEFLKLDGSLTMTGKLNLGGQAIFKTGTRWFDYNEDKWLIRGSALGDDQVPLINAGMFWEKDAAEMYLYGYNSLRLFGAMSTEFARTVSNTTFEFLKQIKLSDLPHATIDTDKFLCNDGGVVKYRTGSELAADIGATGSVTMDDLKEAEMVGATNAQYVATFPHANPTNAGGNEHIALYSGLAAIEALRNTGGEDTNYLVSVGIPLIKVVDGITRYLHIAGVKAYVSDADGSNYLASLSIYGWTSGGAFACGSSQTLNWTTTGLKETTWTGIKCGDKESILVHLDFIFAAANAWGSSPIMLKVYYDA